MNDLVVGISQTLIPSLCLKNIEKLFFEFIANQPLCDIVQLNSEKCGAFLNEFKRKLNLSIDTMLEVNLSDVMIYYHELIIIFKKMKSLIKPTDHSDRFEALLSTQ